MTTHKAEELAEFLEDEASAHRANGFSDKSFIEASILLRTIPTLKAELEALKKENKMLIKDLQWFEDEGADR